MYTPTSDLCPFNGSCPEYHPHPHPGNARPSTTSLTRALSGTLTCHGCHPTSLCTSLPLTGHSGPGTHRRGLPSHTTEPTWEAGRVGTAVLALSPALYTDPNAVRFPQMSALVVFTQFYSSMLDCFASCPTLYVQVLLMKCPNMRRTGSFTRCGCHDSSVFSLSGYYGTEEAKFPFRGTCCHHRGPSCPQSPSWSWGWTSCWLGSGAGW